MNVNTIINLKVISCLEPFQRLNTRAPLFQIKQYRYLPEWFCRFWDGSSRESDFGRVNDLYASAIRNKTQPNKQRASVHRHSLSTGIEVSLAPRAPRLTSGHRNECLFKQSLFECVGKLPDGTSHWAVASAPVLDRLLSFVDIPPKNALEHHVGSRQVAVARCTM